MNNGNFQLADAFALVRSCQVKLEIKPHYRVFLKTMRNTLNLSNQPFRNHRLLWMAILAVFLVSFWMLLWIATEKDVVKAKADAKAALIKSQHDAVERGKLEREKRLREQQPPEVKEQDHLELAAARLLIARRAFNWDQMISDIEHFIPKQTRLTGLKVEQVTTLDQNLTATIEVKAIGQNSAQMTEMMQAFGNTGKPFAVLQTSQDAPDESGGVPFTLNLVYSPSKGDEQ